MKEMFHKKTIQAVHHLPNSAILQIQGHTLFKVCTAKHDSICPFWGPSHRTGITDRLVQHNPSSDQHLIHGRIKHSSEKDPLP